MKLNKIIQFIIFFTLTLNTIKMNAQQNTSIGSSLTAEQQCLIKISALTASGDLESLKLRLAEGLNSGLSINEIKEALVQLYAYCGFPRSINAINTFKTVLDERKKNNITDKPGKEIVVENNVDDKYEQGRNVLEQLTKVQQLKPAPGLGEFAPRIDAFLKEHLFADIFASDVLSYQQREFVTIAALSAISGVEPQLQAHLNMGKNMGITENQLVEIADMIEETINRTQANVLRKLNAKETNPIIEPDMMVRISEIEIVPEFLDEYKSILQEESSASVKIEPGVIAIFPMYQKENTSQVRIVEIYANKNAYESHIKTPHFQNYKTSILKMIKSLKLVDMDNFDKETMFEIFKKIK